MSLFERLKNIKNRPDRVEPGISPVILPKGQEISSELGKYILLEREMPGNFYFPDFDYSVLHTNLRLLKGIGPVTEEKLRRQGYKCVFDLLHHPRWSAHAVNVMDLIQSQQLNELQMLGARSWELLSYFEPEDILFIDIETTGLWASQPLFLIGLLYYRQGKFFINQLFARNYGEEKAVIAAAHEIFRNFKVLVSYNGKRFDVPYIIGRSIEHRLFYSYPHYQVDMLFHARRHFGNTLPDCKLVTLEINILKFQREDDIPGYLIPETYHRFAQKQDAGLILPVLKHNRLDLLSMARLFKPVVHGPDSD